MLLLATGIALALWQEVGRLRGGGVAAEAPSLEAGDPVPEFSTTSTSNERLASAHLRGPSRSMLIFTSATCGPCHELLPDLAEWRRMLKGRLDIYVIAAGNEAENRRLAEEHTVPVFLDPDAGIMRAFGAPGTPSVIEIAPGGVIQTAAVPGAVGIEAVIRAALKRPESPPALAVTLTGPGSSGGST
jgi:peroxiredoxin